MSSTLFDTHQKTLDGARAAIKTRDFWSAYPEIPSGKFYGESAKDDGIVAFKKRLNTTFDFDLPGSSGTVGGEKSPFGIELNIQYPKPDLDNLIAAAKSAIPKWRDAGIEARTGVCLEILHRLNRRSFEIAFAVMHTTGQGFMMAFQAGGPHAQERGLEAVAYAYEEMTRHPESADWTKRVGKTEFVTLRKRFRIAPRGVSAVIGCSTFPTWNGYPALFASLVTGNAVVVKPHPGAILPLAITVEIARKVLREQGFDANLVTLAADTLDAPIAKDLVTRPEVKLVDYTGSSAFGAWIEQNARQAVVFTEKAGVNCCIIDSARDLKAVTANLAFSLSLYSGQMCTAPQNVFIPKSGIRASDKTLSFDDVAAAIVKAVDWLHSDPNRSAEVLGAIQNENTAARTDAAAEGADVLRKSEPVANAQFADARTRSPLILKTDAANKDVYMREMFGPISYVVPTDDTDHSIELTAECAQKHGAISCSLYSTDDAVLQRAEDRLLECGVPLSCNFTGPIYPVQAAAFSDFHVTGANAAGNATFCDAAFVAPRFRIIQTRTPVTSA